MLQRALRSIKAQSYTNFEALVIDDGSDTATLEQYRLIWQELDERFRLHLPCATASGGNGPSAARNRGIQQARGDFVAFLDDDDYWTSTDHLAVGIDVLRRCDASYYFANMQGLRASQVIKPDWYPDSPELTAGRRVNDQPQVFEVPLNAFLRVMHHHFVHPDSSIIARALLTQVGGFFERLNFGEDYDLMMRIADEVGRILYRPDCVVHYRFPERDSVSLTQSPVAQTLQRLFSTQHVRATCRRPLVRRCARAREGWSLREMAQQLGAEDRHAAAISFAWQALCVYPTLGAASSLASTLIRGVRRVVFHPPGK